MLFYFFKDFACQNNNGGCAIAYFSVLGTGYVGQYSRSRMDYIEQLMS